MNDIFLRKTENTRPTILDINVYKNCEKRRWLLQGSLKYFKRF